MESQRSPSNRGEIAPFFVMEVMRAAEERELAGDQVLHLEVGQPSTPAPAGVIEAAHRALDEDVLGYTTAAGTPELRARVARHYDEWYGVEVHPDRLMFTVGASGAFVAAFLAAFDVGDRVVVPSPGYPCYRNALEALGCEVVDMPTTLETRFQPTVELLDRIVADGGPIAGLVLSSPSNPTGTMLDIDRMTQITSWCRANGVWFVSDEIYHGLSYGEPAPTALQFDPDAIVINSFSKYFSMTGIDHLIESGHTTDSQALCAVWLDELGLASTPGVDFDPTRGHRFVRFSFAGSTEDCAEAMGRLKDWTMS
ncbi:MAG: aminotransferase class I/II-fold pyridoxal phosphate-dependent enzyme [Acidimicrobiia bacterium]|nr:aminotransferase class I/II-fold pyridoxal phosphate-dependent enzyme [Acidimicrobiia bacterium]